MPHVIAKDEAWENKMAECDRLRRKIDELHAECKSFAEQLDEIYTAGFGRRLLWLWQGIRTTKLRKGKG